MDRKGLAPYPTLLLQRAACLVQRNTIISYRVGGSIFLDFCSIGEGNKKSDGLQH